MGKPEGGPRRKWEGGYRMDLGESGRGVCSGNGPVAVSRECSDETSGSGAMELVSC